jgi:hypothetical protein
MGETSIVQGAQQRKKLLERAPMRRWRGIDRENATRPVTGVALLTRTPR